MYISGFSWLEAFIRYIPYILRVDEKLSIKVADFGLARDIYTTEYYRMNQHTIIPVKWMALEALLDGYFDEKTDMVRIHIFIWIYIST